MSKLSRRNFIKTSSASAAVLAAGSLAGVSGKESAAGSSDVYTGKGTAAETIPKIIKKMGGMERFVKKGSRVLIKPNISFANPADWATTTSPEAMHTVAKLCLDAGARKVIFCDYTLRDSEICKQKTGAAAALKDLKGAIIYTPDRENQFEEKTSDKATELTRTAVVKEIARCNTLISLPIAKSHSSGGVSLGIKGLMGLIWDRRIFHREMDLHMAIAEQLYYIKPDLTIIDASRALLDNGPSGPGKVAQLDTYVAGTDPVATDSFAVTLADWYGRKVEGINIKHLKNAARLGFGNVESGKIKEIVV
ncbi:MAG: DUF362 domain-containing protein [Fibrobacteria bacterium]|nr:DUF362 domain-containing protein [Fibrobacteria bacterium]